eukprot:CAMPEP_0206627210 /NCGR_PEP_ID=MMETSP0325_2-20121206/65801_1 /ASSEMBLY_ACC=CAM_ASM_000347 /TAXON_ID=2866 /ORGANISM="Crypthecodinium cohnii, Strain Seligo" /LENGTH=32 /DNA_ID= /DNA_START= /DNA_END= /DNA_ORIENTATION=
MSSHPSHWVMSSPSLSLQPSNDDFKPEVLCKA